MPSPTVQTHDAQVRAPAESTGAAAGPRCNEAWGEVEISSLHVSLSHPQKRRIICQRGLGWCCLLLSGRVRPAPVAACERFRASAAPPLDIWSRSRSRAWCRCVCGSAEWTRQTWCSWPLPGRCCRFPVGLKTKGFQRRGSRRIITPSFDSTCQLSVVLS